jgi:hypothetical protein
MGVGGCHGVFMRSRLLSRALSSMLPYVDLRCVRSCRVVVVLPKPMVGLAMALMYMMGVALMSNVVVEFDKALLCLFFGVFTIGFGNLLGASCCCANDVCRGWTWVEGDVESYLTSAEGGISGGGDGEGEMAVNAIATVGVDQGGIGWH